MNRSFQVVAGTVMNREKFDEDFGDTYEFERMDNDLIAYDGFEANHEEIVIGVSVAKFTGAGDVDSMHSLDVHKRFEETAPEVKRQLQDIGVEKPVSIYTVTEFH